MNRKNANIAILLIIIVIAIFVTLGFFGIGGFQGGQESSNTPTGQAILDELNATGTVADLRIEDLVEGTGDPVQSGDSLTVHYVGVLPDGTVFDSSRERGTPFTFTIGDGFVIQGWDRGLIGMKKGGTRLLVIPAQLGYGATGVGQIPPNATLIFEVELVDRVPKTSAQ